MLSKTFIADLVLDTHIQSTFLVSAKATRQTKYGDAYLCVTLIDRTGAIEARAWENAELLAERFCTDDFVIVSGQVSSYQDTLQLKLIDIQSVGDEAVEVTDFLPSSRWEPEALFAQLKELVLEHVQGAPMRAFFKTLFGQHELMERFKRAPAAKTNHHNFIGGLLEHVLSMAREAVLLADHYARYYPGLINRDLLMAGCVLHDIGKCRELSFTRSFAYTTHGQLIGHIPHGIEIVNDIQAAMRPAPPEEMILAIKHLILSHHGRLDYGSPVTPRTPEAMLLHQIDMIDSRMAMCAAAIARHAGPTHGPDRWTDYHRALETRIYLGGEQDELWRTQPEHDADELVGPGAALADTPNPTASWSTPKHAANEDGRKRAPGAGNTLDLFGE